MLKIQRDWRPDMNDDTIYEKTRGHWLIAAHVRDRMVNGYAFDIVRSVYRIRSWFRSEKPWDAGKNRWGFDGAPATELAHALGTHVRDAFPNQVMYRRFLDGYPGSPSPGTVSVSPGSGTSP